MRRPDKPLSDRESERYARQITLPPFGLDAQQKLKHARVAVIGAGGLGSSLLQYLTAAGLGTIGIFDFDRIELSNLQRQVLFHDDDIGSLKASTAASRLQQMNPHVNIETHEQRISPANAVSLLDGYDVVADGCDNFLTRYVVNDACLLLDIPLVYGSIYQFEGQLSVFNYVDKQGKRGPEYRDVFPVMPRQGFIPNCAEAGVMGALPGIIGSAQALEVIKIIAGLGEVLSGRMLITDTLSMDFSVMDIPAPASNAPLDKTLILERLQALIPVYEALLHQESCAANTRNISPEQLQQMRVEGATFSLIDVRTAEEHRQYNMGGELIPLDQIAGQAGRIPTDTTTILYCGSGKRSAEAITIIQQQTGATNLYNLEGGVLAYRRYMEQSGSE